MVYEIVWTDKAVESYVENMQYLEENWTEKEIANFAGAVEKKISVLSKHPEIGHPQSKKHTNTRYVVLHKRVALIYRIREKHKRIELLLFWNTYQYPAKLKIK